jgi:L-ascorbate metabolism protein UlaG (beta-lactamase superfamily)
MTLAAHPGDAKALLEGPLPDGVVGLAWLGQAGFALRHANHRLLIDPYLSDHLARKYAGTEFPHVRMMPAPVAADDLRDLDWVLCSHRHGDHMDPGSLPTLAKNNPRCRFIVPKAEMESARQIGLDECRLILANAGDTIRFDSSFEIRVIASAHETLKTNDKGEHHFLGFVLRLAGVTIYHSGDCVVYEGLADRLREQSVDLALLPVNGRNEHLTARGILGNMTFDEARALCIAAGTRAMIPHHFGMFDFNTVDPSELRRKINNLDPTVLQCVLPHASEHYFWV